MTFPDFSEATSVGEDQGEALLNAVDAIETAIDFYFNDRRPVPLPSKAKRGKLTVELPSTVSAKVLIWNELLSQNLRKADLARRLNVHMPQIDRLFNIRHSSKIEFVKDAAKVLGKKLSVELV